MSANPPRAATVRLSIATIEADPGPPLARYNLPLDRPVLYRWALGDVSTPDSRAVLDHTGGSLGNWLEVLVDDQGADLTDADDTVTVGDGRLFFLPAATLTANRALTLSATNARRGHEIEVVRLDVGAFTYALKDGVSAATKVTMPISARSRATLRFDGTNWVHRSSALML